MHGYRKQPKNMLMAGLWCSPDKPPMQLFLKPVVEMLRKLESEGSYIEKTSTTILLMFSNVGVQVHPSGVEHPFQMKVCVIGFSCDLPARATVQNFVQFNGFHGCSFCEQPGKTVSTSKGGHVHAFPYQHSSPKGPPRTQLGCVLNAAKAVEEHSVVNFAYNYVAYKVIGNYSCL